jgi:chromosome partitioning protein
MRTIAVIARKGGSGKTTVATHLALAAHLRGMRTVLADTDPQGSSTETLKGRMREGPQYFRTTGPALRGIVRGTDAPAEALIIDTPAASEAEAAHAIAMADLALLIVRPTFLDLAASLQTAQILRRLRKPGLIVLNQAPTARGGVEPPAVKRALEALTLMRLPVAPVILRARAAFQIALEKGLSVEEMVPHEAAAEEVRQLWTFIEHFAFGKRAA